MRSFKRFAVLREGAAESVTPAALGHEVQVVGLRRREHGFDPRFALVGNGSRRQTRVPIRVVRVRRVTQQSRSHVAAKTGATLDLGLMNNATVARRWILLQHAR